jgi:hypothetical protein
VILYNDRDSFDKATDRFKLVIEKYQAALRGKLSQCKAAFEERIIEEFAPRWAANPPNYFARWGFEPSSAKIRTELQWLAEEIFATAISFDEPKVKVLYKNVAPESIRDSAFLEVLKIIMVKRRVPRDIIASLFESGQVAPETGAFL